MGSMRCDHFAKPIEPTLKGFLARWLSSQRLNKFRVPQGTWEQVESRFKMNPTGVGGFSKGQSGNPGGRRKKTAEDIEVQQNRPPAGRDRYRCAR
jgi:hypothetical protein